MAIIYHKYDMPTDGKKKSLGWMKTVVKSYYSTNYSVRIWILCA